VYTINDFADSSDWYLRLVVFYVGFLRTLWRRLFFNKWCGCIRAEKPALDVGRYEYSCVGSFSPMSPIKGHTS
jgi:hypothetical protein